MERLFLRVSCADAFLTQWVLRVAVPVSLMLLVLSGCTDGAGKAGFVEDRAGLLTDGQQDNELKAITRNGAGEVIFWEDRAVIRFPLSNRQASPFFSARDL